MLKFFLVITMTTGVVEKPMPNELACTMAAVGAQISAAQIAGAAVISAVCKREKV